MVTKIMDFFTLLAFHINLLVMMALKIMGRVIFVFHKVILVSKDIKMMADKLRNVLMLTPLVMKDSAMTAEEMFVYHQKVLVLKDTKMMEEELKTVF